MTSERTITVSIARNRIAFEGLAHFPDDGNGQEHTKAAASAWAPAAERVLQERFGRECSADIRYERDAGRLTVLATVLDADGDECEPTPEERAEINRVAEVADEAGWKSANETIWHG